MAIRQGALILIFLILIWGGVEHFSREIIVAAEASSTVSFQPIGVSKFPNSANNQFVLLNRLNLIACYVKSGMYCYLRTLPICDWWQRNRFYNFVNPWRFPICSIPERYFCGPISRNGFSISDINYREPYRNNLISHRIVELKMTNNQLWTMRCHKFIASKVNGLLRETSLLSGNARQNDSENCDDDSGSSSPKRGTEKRVNHSPREIIVQIVMLACVFFGALICGCIVVCRD